MKSCSWAVRETQIKTIGWHLHAIAVTKIKTSSNTKCWWGYGETGALTRCWWEREMARPLWKAVWQFLVKLNMQLMTIRPHNYTHGHIYPREMEVYVHVKTCSWMLIPVLYAVDNLLPFGGSGWTGPNNHLLHGNHRNERLTHMTSCGSLQGHRQSEKSQFWKGPTLCVPLRNIFEMTKF